MTSTSSVVLPAVSTLRFLRKGEVVSLSNVAPDRTLLQLLREDLSLTGAKEGCGEGDCGACIVVLGQLEDGALRFRAVNSCIRLAHSIDGMALWSVEDLAAADGTLHPAQQAMVECHASQCGFCTPGFVMSLFAMYEQAPTLPTACASLPPEGALSLRPGEAGSAAPAGEEAAATFAAAPANWQNQIRGPGSNGVNPKPITRELAQEALSGNLCRCTGYRPILDAALLMGSLPPALLDTAGLILKLEQFVPADIAEKADFAYKSAYAAPRTLAGLLEARALRPDTQLVAGCTDVGLWVTKQYRQFDKLLDLTRVQELRRIDDHPDHIAIGAAVTLADAFAALVRHRPQLHNFAVRFAGLPVRNSGTLGGNVANGSPIGDSMPLLIALRAQVVLMSVRGERAMPLEQLYTGYRTNVMAADEVLAWIRVPKPGSPVLQTAARPEAGLLRAVQMRAGATKAAALSPRPLPEGEGVSQGTTDFSSSAHQTLSARAGLPASTPAPESAPSPLWGEGGGEGRLSEFLRIYKISKRYDDDISAVCLGLNLHIGSGLVQAASIGAGGVAATPARAVQTEAALTGQPWTLDTVQRAIAVLRSEFSPLSDMRASAGYRTEVLGNLLLRYWLESQGLQQINLAAFILEEAP